MLSQVYHILSVFLFYTVLADKDKSSSSSSSSSSSLSSVHPSSKPERSIRKDSKAGNLAEESVSSLHASDWDSSIRTESKEGNLTEYFITEEGAPSTDMDDFRRHLHHCDYLLAITGAGLSAESGIPAFRGAKGVWRNTRIRKFNTPEGFEDDPSSVWQFYHYRRELARTKEPNGGHYALKKIEDYMKKRNRNFTLITMNVDGLQKDVGSKEVIELHGNMYETYCTKCNDTRVNLDSPICSALNGTENNLDKFERNTIPVEKLPRCKLCNGLLRPNSVLYFEDLNRTLNDMAWDAIHACDLALLIGTTSIVFPGALFSPQINRRRVPVAEFNVKQESYSESFSYFFEGKISETLTKALDPDWVDPEPEKYKPSPIFRDNDAKLHPAKSRWGSSASTSYDSATKFEIDVSNPPPLGTGLNMSFSTSDSGSSATSSKISSESSSSESKSEKS